MVDILYRIKSDKIMGMLVNNKTIKDLQNYGGLEQY